MSFQDIIRADLDTIYTAGEFAEEITVNGAAVLAMVGSPSSTEEQSPAVLGVALSVSVRVNELISVSHGDAVVVNGVNYIVTGDPLSDGLEWSIDLARNMVSL
jgi:hypothetical protein